MVTGQWSPVVSGQAYVAAAQTIYGYVRLGIQCSLILWPIGGGMKNIFPRTMIFLQLLHFVNLDWFEIITQAH